MPRALFLLPAADGIDQIPVIENDGTNGGIYYRDNGELVGGIWIAPETEAPQPNTIAVIIHSSDEMLDELAANPDYLFLEDLPDG